MDRVSSHANDLELIHITRILKLAFLKQAVAMRIGSHAPGLKTAIKGGTYLYVVFCLCLQRTKSPVLYFRASADKNAANLRETSQLRVDGVHDD
jgi:hypothetical protein